MFPTPIDIGRWRRAAARRLDAWRPLAMDVLFPPMCASCQASIDSSTAQMVCDACQAELLDARRACFRCGLPAPDGNSDDCLRCHGKRYEFAGVARLGSYEGMLRLAVLRAKRPAHRGLAIALGDMLAAERAAQLGQWNLDAVVPVPMHWTRRALRGCNSASTIADRVAARLKVPLAAHLLARRRRTAAQARLSPPKRRANVRGAFRARHHVDLPGSRLLVVDDIMTTGATANEAAKMLMRAGASFVAIAVVARAIDDL